MTWRQRSGNKYHAKSIMYGGYQYHSKKEAAYAADLDLRMKAEDGDVKDWTRQVKVSLDVNGMHITNYFVDFQVELRDGRTQLVEVKGFDTEVFRLKRLLLEATYLKEHPEVEYLIVR
jgi:hypothetical protein